MSEKKDEESVLDYLLELAHLQRILAERERAKHAQSTQHEQPAEVIHESPQSHMTTVLTMIPEKSEADRALTPLAKATGPKYFAVDFKAIAQFARTGQWVESDQTGKGGQQIQGGQGGPGDRPGQATDAAQEDQVGQAGQLDPDNQADTYQSGQAVQGEQVDRAAQEDQSWDSQKK